MRRNAGSRSAVRSRRSARAAAGLLLGLGGAVGLSPGASATTSPPGPTMMTFTSPPAQGATLSQAPIVLSGNINQPGGLVDGVDAKVTWTDTAPGRIPGPHPPQSTSASPSGPQSTFSWSFSPVLAYNGGYTVTVVASTTAADGSSPAQPMATRSFVVNVPPAPPTGVTDVVDASRRVTTLSWDRNAEPDLIGYEVFRAGPAANDAGHVINGVPASQTTYTDDEVATEASGTYRYQIVAVRQSGAGTTPDLSSPSVEVAAALTTPARAAPPPASTTSGPTPAQSGVKTGTAGGTSAQAPGSGIILPPASGQIPGYSALLGQARATTVTTMPPDPGFNQQLPYQPLTTHQAIALPSVESGTLAAQGGGSSDHRSIEFIAAALMLAVLAMFGMVLKRSAEQSAVLEALAPAGSEAATAGTEAAMAGAGPGGTSPDPVAEPTLSGGDAPVLGGLGAVAVAGGVASPVNGHTSRRAGTGSLLRPGAEEGTAEDVGAVPRPAGPRDAVAVAVPGSDPVPDPVAEVAADPGSDPVPDPVAEVAPDTGPDPVPDPVADSVRVRSRSRWGERAAAVAAALAAEPAPAQVFDRPQVATPQTRPWRAEDQHTGAFPGPDEDHAPLVSPLLLVLRAPVSTVAGAREVAEASGADPVPVGAATTGAPVRARPLQSPWRVQEPDR